MIRMYHFLKKNKRSRFMYTVYLDNGVIILVVFSMVLLLWAYISNIRLCPVIKYGTWKRDTYYIHNTYIMQPGRRKWAPHSFNSSVFLRLKLFQPFICVHLKVSVYFNLFLFFSQSIKIKWWRNSTSIHVFCVQ